MPSVVVGAGDSSFAGSPPRPLAFEDRAGLEELTAPDTPRLGTLERTRQAPLPHWARSAHSLGLFEYQWLLGKEQLRILASARQNVTSRGGSTPSEVEEARGFVIRARWFGELRHVGTLIRA